MPSRPIVLRTDFSWQCAHKLLQSSRPELVPDRFPNIAGHRGGAQVWLADGQVAV